MGLLKDFGVILPFEQGDKIQKVLKKIGIRQFIRVFKQYCSWEKTTDSRNIKWGQQIEGHFLCKSENGSLKLCRENISEEYSNLEFPLFFQYGSWMFEMTPLEPYNTGCNFNQIVITIRQKYKLLQSKSRIALTIPCVPFIGVRNKQAQSSFINQVTQSRFIDDNYIANHPRFPTLTKNIRTRRGKTVQIKVPIFKDQNTDLVTVTEDQPYPGFIYMDAMAFGMGLCCLQCTFSTKNLSHARYIHDQLHVISPIFLALTAGTPFHKGKLAQWDARWKIIEGSVDDRNEKQRNAGHEDYLRTGRYAPMQYYIWEGEFNKQKFSDCDLNLKNETVGQIEKAAQQMDVAIDVQLKRHLASLFNRDILIVHQKFKQMTSEDDVLFQMLNGTNWNSVRLKIPINQDIGWRVEFRTMEIMLTPDENSAFSLIIHLITRALHYSQDLNLYIPISKVNQNFDRAHANNALLQKKFYWRTNVIGNEDPQIQQLTIHQILFGKANYAGLFKLMNQRIIDKIKICPKMLGLIDSLRMLLQNLATGKKITLAQYMRNYIYASPQYKKDSIIPKKLMDQLMEHLYLISCGKIQSQNFGRIFEF